MADRAGNAEFHAESEAGTARRGRRDAVGEQLVTAYLVGSALVRALFFTGLGLALFLLAFLGYFTVSFVFLGAALAMVASSALWRRFRRPRGQPRARAGGR